MTTSMNLTKDEVRVITNLRQRKEKTASGIRLLLTAANYVQWLTDEKARDTYLAFCGGFGYDADEGEHRLGTYEVVIELIYIAHGEKT